VRSPLICSCMASARVVAIGITPLGVRQRGAEPMGLPAGCWEVLAENRYSRLLLLAQRLADECGHEVKIPVDLRHHGRGTAGPRVGLRERGLQSLRGVIDGCPCGRVWSRVQRPPVARARADDCFLVGKMPVDGEAGDSGQVGD
jgi:hypothetical protein